MVRSMLVAALLAGSLALSAQGRNQRPNTNDDFGRPAGAWCDAASRWNRSDRVACDVREQSLPDVAALDVDTGGNGGIAVHGTSGSTTRLRFRLVTHGRTVEDARDLAKDIEITTDGGRVRARGPRSHDGEGWAVDVEIQAPRDLPLTLTTNNGGISIEDVSGRTRFDTTNGGVSLADVSGDMRGRTVNGGLSVRLDGQRWSGAGLDIETTNGGVRMSLPDGYNAELSAETTNGGLDIDFPVTVQGRLTALNRRIVTTLGSGGPRLHVRTVNGGVSIVRR